MAKNLPPPLKIALPAAQKALLQAFQDLAAFQIVQDGTEDCTIQELPQHFSLSVPKTSFKADLKKPARFGFILDEALKLAMQHKQSMRDKQVNLGDLIFDPALMCMTRGNDVMELTEKEVAVLQTLLAAAPEAVSRDDLLQSVWSYHPDVTTHTVETHLWRLRQKIERDPSAPDIIVTTPEGYAFGVEVRGET